jgi:anti-sigma regulatory factor (Ser/Thr protein kinase)
MASDIHVTHREALITRFDRDLRVVAMNDAALQIAGHEPEKIIGRTSHELGCPPVWLDVWSRHHRQVFDSGVSVLVFDLPTTDGTSRYHTTLAPIFGADAEVTEVAVISTRTERECADERRWRPGERVVVHLGSEPGNVAFTRRVIAAHSRGVGASNIASEVELVVSELVANIVEHGAAPAFEVSARSCGGVYAVTVRQASCGTTIPPLDQWTMPSTRSVRGRGLGIVRALAEHIELDMREGHTEVRCTFSVT